MEKNDPTQGTIEALRTLSTTGWRRTLLRRPGPAEPEPVDLEDEACRWEQQIVRGGEVSVWSERPSPSEPWADPVVCFGGRSVPWTAEAVQAALVDQWPAHVHPDLRDLVVSISSDSW